MARRLVSLCTFAAALFSASASAAPCVGFTDVDDASGFCPAVHWLRNRQITLGCTSTTLYCPNALVSRLSMAAFMNRLGTALTPTVLYAEATGASLDLDAPPPVICSTTALAPATFPRYARATALLSGRFETSGIVALRLVASSDNGVTWNALGAHASSAGGANRWVHVTAVFGNFDVAPGASYRFGVSAQRSGSGNGNLGAWNCQLEASATSRTGSADPF